MLTFGSLSIACTRATSRTWLHLPGPPTFQCATLKSWDGPGYEATNRAGTTGNDVWSEAGSGCLSTPLASASRSKSFDLACTIHRSFIRELEIQAVKSTEVLNTQHRCGSIRVYICMVDVGCKLFSSYIFTFLMRCRILIGGMYYDNCADA